MTLPLLVACSDASPSQTPDADAQAGSPDASSTPRDDAAVADASDASDASPKDAAVDHAPTCGAVEADCSVNTDCCSGRCAFTGRGGQCAQTCSTNGECASGCCSAGTCSPTEFCQSTFTCWPLGHGCASAVDSCCGYPDKVICIDISLAQGGNPIDVCSAVCTSDTDCTSGCCLPFDVGNGTTVKACHRSLACRH